jgi:hypothetical protein
MLENHASPMRRPSLNFRVRYRIMPAIGQSLSLMLELPTGHSLILTFDTLQVQLLKASLKQPITNKSYIICILSRIFHNVNLSISVKHVFCCLYTESLHSAIDPNNLINNEHVCYAVNFNNFNIMSGY